MRVALLYSRINAAFSHNTHRFEQPVSAVWVAVRIHVLLATELVLNAAITGTTIFIVDDNDGTRRSLRRFFEIFGFTVRDYASGETFLAELPTSLRGCLILDFNLPGLDGFEILRRVRFQGWHLPVIIVTGSDAPEEQATRLGASAFFRKPADPNALAAKVIAAVSAPP